MENVFEGIDIENLSQEEAVELIRQIKTAQAKLSAYDVKPNYRKSDLFHTAKNLLQMDKVHLFEVEEAIINIADFCTNNYTITQTGRKRKEAHVAYEKKDKYLKVLSGILSVILEALHE